MPVLFLQRRTQISIIPALKGENGTSLLNWSSFSTSSWSRSHAWHLHWKPYAPRRTFCRSALVIRPSTLENHMLFKMRPQQSNDQPSVPDHCWSMRSSPEIEITICQFFPILNAPVSSKLLQIFNLLHNYLSAPCLADLVTRHHRQLMVNNTTIKKLEIVVH